MKTTETFPSTSQTTTPGPMSSELHSLFLDQLGDAYDAEKQLTEALPKMAKAALSGELRSAFESHLKETIGHAEALEKIAESLGEELPKVTCKAMKGLIKEGEQMMKENKHSKSLDAALIAAAQKVEHYEIATYGTLCAWAEEMGHNHELALLSSTLQQEKNADTRLTEIAKSLANRV